MLAAETALRLLVLYLPLDLSLKVEFDRLSVGFARFFVVFALKLRPFHAFSVGVGNHNSCQCLQASVRVYEINVSQEYEQCSMRTKIK